MLKIAAALIVAFASFACGCADEWEAPTGPNLVANPSFEAVAEGVPLSWSAPSEVYRVDDSGGRTGDRCLRFSNDDPQRYQLCTQTVDLEPGSVYEYSVWVRTAGLHGGSASICVEWADAAGGYLGGSYADGVSGDTAQWTQVRGIARVPENAARCTVTCYVTRGGIGSAWWDDASVRRWRERPMRTFLVTPPYRGLILNAAPPYLEANVELLTSQIKGGAGGALIVARLSPAGDDRPVAAAAVEDLAGDRVSVRVPIADLKPGSYTLTIALVDRETGQAICEEAHRVTRRTGFPPKCYIDENNRLIVDGKPFFPLGMYWSNVSEDELRVYKEGPFNCLMPYGSPNREQMDLVNRFGLKVIYSIKDFYYGTEWCPDFIQSEADEERAVRDRVREFCGHPALLAWYTNDERPLTMLPRLEAHQRWVEEEDPNHPTWVVLFQVDQVGSYLRTFDVIGTDPYPIPDRPAAMAGEWAATTRRAVADGRPLWMVPQAFRWPDKRPPTFDEMRSMAWQCIAEGADGLIFYSWFDLRNDPEHPFAERWGELKRVAQEISDMIPVLLSVEEPPAVDVQAPGVVHWTIRRYQGAAYVILVNGGEEPATASVRFARPLERVVLAGKSVALSGDREFRASLPPLAVQIYRAEM